MLSAPRRRAPYTLPLAAYPQSLQDEVARFAERLGGGHGHGGRSGGRFLLAAADAAAAGPRRALRPRTIAARLFVIRQMLGILVLHGHRPEEITSLRYVFDPLERAGTILDWLHRRQQKDDRDEEVLGGQLAQVAETMHQIGRYWLKLDEATCGQLAAWAADAQAPRRAGLTPKNRERLRRLIQPRPYALLLHLPQELMRRARALAAGGAPRAAARLALLAAGLEILLVFPMRLENLAGLRTDRHLQRLGARGRRVTHVVLRAAETKNRKPIEWPLPAESAALLEEYLRRFRPTIATPENPYLFPGRDRRGGRSPGAVASGLVATIAAEVGVAVNVHLLRHFAAWLYLRRHPGRYGDVRDVLGHKSVSTTEAFYVAFDEVAAAERFDATVLAERRATRAAALAGWRASAGTRRVRRGPPPTPAAAPPVAPPVEGGRS